MDLKALVTKATGSWYRLRDEQNNFFDARLRGFLKLEQIKATNIVVVGDWVEFEKSSDNTYVIVGVLQRNNYVIRNAAKSSKLYHIIAANLNLTVVFVSTSSPTYSFGFIDRCLLTCEAYSIPVMIVLTKSDTWTVKDLKKANKIEGIYKPIGYKMLTISSVTESGIEPLKKNLQDKVTLFIGKSGVGKTSLINKLIPNLNLKTQEVSKKTNKGKHCTTFSEMFFLDNNTSVIDIPGIKELVPSDMGQDEISHYFPEMRAKMHSCKFKDCRHLREKECAVIKALDNGEIAPSRYKTYLSLLQ